MDTISIVQGTNKDIKFQLRDANEAAVTDLPEDATLQAVIWGGDDQATLVSPAASWVDDDPTTGQGIIHLTANELEGFEPAVYRLLVTLIVDDAPVEALSAYLKIDPAPGSAIPLRSYITYGHLLTAFPNLEALQTDSNQAGFAEARSQASRHLDSLILSKVSLGGGREYVRGLLDDDKLTVDQGVIDLVTSSSLALILEGKLTGNRGQNDPYPDLAKRYRARAENLARTLTIFIEGYRPVDLSSIPVRRG